MPDHRAKIGAGRRLRQPDLPRSGRVTEVEVRVNYSETDQMGVVYHARYAVWLDIARTEHLRTTGITYRELEEAGFRLVVAALHIEFRQPARYDDPVIVQCWVCERASRKVTFAYTLRHGQTGDLLAWAETPMIVLDAAWRPTRLPDDVAQSLAPVLS